MIKIKKFLQKHFKNTKYLMITGMAAACLMVERQ